MRTLELLAPAKNLECGMAAIDHGADAVYIGADRFGARMAAGNSVDDIARLCSYAHIYGAKVYVTVNTIVYDHELEDTYRLLLELAEAGADAILVQDMAVARYIREHLSGQLDMHASTQTDNRTADKVRWLTEQGFSRIVLARELSISEIAAIHHEVPQAELEVFVHGALCVSYSGLCYASQYCFQRSANRGECAQFCRMKFTLEDAEGKVIEKDWHLLSLKDMNQLEQLERLAEAGASSFKIEGRLKDLAYVKNVTAAYSEQLNSVIARHPDKYRRASQGKCTYTFVPDLRKSFNRGYTTYFAEGRQPGIASFDTPKAIGEFVGTVKEVRGKTLTVAGTARFANGDGLCFLNADRQLEGFRVNKAEGNKLSLLQMPASLRSGMKLYRNHDAEFDKVLSRPSAVRKIPVAMQLSPTANGFQLNMSGVTVALNAEHTESRTPQRDNIVRQLTKLGGTPYDCTEVTLPDGFNFFIPSSQLATLRRMAVETLIAETAGTHGHRQTPVTTAVTPPPPYARTFLNNIANDAARNFYSERGLTDQEPAFEVRQPRLPAPLMQCRHCLRYALGGCVKYGGKHPSWKEPLSLRLGDGRKFKLIFDCIRCQMNVMAQSLVLLLVLLFTSCYQQEPQTSDAWILSDRQMDSISFFTTHHYTQNFNFVVKGDSLPLIVQHPTEALSNLLVDTINLLRGDRLVVADIIKMPADSIDSVWVKVARDQETIGWTHERHLLSEAAPDAPISRFIDFFSDTHLIIFLAVLVVVAASYLIMRMMKRNAKIVHLNDIDSFYPSLLAVSVAAAAVFYSTIQLFAPESWRHYYYHPTLNPFSVPLHLGLFITSVWMMVVIAIATIDDVRRCLPLTDAVVYLLGLAGVCALNYVVFSVTTLYYIGYPLLVAYVVFAGMRYLHRS